MTNETPLNEPLGQPRFQFGLLSLFLLTLLVACVLSAYRCLGPAFGTIAAAPLGMVAIMLLSTRWRCVVGVLVGTAILALLGFYLVRWNPSKPEYVKAVVTLAAFGGAIGGSVHTIILRRRVLGGTFLTLSILILLGTLLG